MADGLELVIFDCDGVLVDTERIANQALADLVTEVGLPTSLQDSLDTFMGRSLADIVVDVEDRLGRSVGDDFADRYYERIFAVFDQGVAPIEGVEAVLAGLRWPCCVASNGPHAKMDRTLAASGLEHYVAGRVFSAHDVGRGKPAPDLFLHAASELGAAPARCVVVEDSSHGVEAAVAAGMAVLGYSPPGADNDPERLVAAGAHLFGSMDELPGLLDALDAELAAA